MKTTVNLPDELLREAQEVARREGTTLRQLIETGLRAAVRDLNRDAGFTLSDASVDGRGLQQDFRGTPWAHVRDTIYGPME